METTADPRAQAAPPPSTAASTEETVPAPAAVGEDDVVSASDVAPSLANVEAAAVPAESEPSASGSEENFVDMAVESDAEAEGTAPSSSTEAPIDSVPDPSSKSALDDAIARTLAELETAGDSPMPTESGSVAPSAPDVEPQARSTRFESTPVSQAQLDILEAGRQKALAFAAKTKGTALSRVAQLNARVEKDPLDGEARLALIADAEQKGDLERTRAVYEDFLKVFPDAAPQWIAYANLELSHGLFGNVEALFARCLRTSVDVDVWKFYIDYIRRVTPIEPTQTDSAKTARATIAKSFEYALQHVGLDRKAGDMWMEYITFLKEGQNRGTWEDQQRMDALRSAYSRAVIIPLNNVEAIWQEYSAFENNLSKLTAKKFLSELSPGYMTARKCLRELRAQFDHLPAPALPHRPDWSSRDDRDSLEVWRKYVAYEEANPLDFEKSVDAQGKVVNPLQTRVSFVLRKAVCHMRFFSEIWCLTADYSLRSAEEDAKLHDAKMKEACTLLRTGLEANPSSLMLAYKLTELEEGRQDLTACNKVYDALLDHFHAQLTALDEATERETATALEEYDAKHASDADDLDAEAREKVVQEKEELKQAVVARRESEVSLAKKGAASVWITQMRFARRAEGIKQSRAVFAKARRSKHLMWQVIEASAKMELHWNNDPKIATNVFELGLKTFSKDPEYVLQYLDFLIQTNNPNNARALFERTAALVEPSKSKAIWDRMAQYEYQYGDYLAAQKISLRYSEAFADARPADLFSQKYGYLGLDEAFSQDLGISQYSSRDRSRSRSRSASPPRRKRGLSNERSNYERPASVDRDFHGNGGAPINDFKRLRPNTRVEGSPAPSSNSGWNGRDHEPPTRRPLDHHPSHHAPTPPPPQLNRPIPFALDPRGDRVAILPDAVVFFLSILPSAASFKGPMLDPGAVTDVIANTLLPGTAPGPGLPGERLGIPPRVKGNQPMGRHNGPPPQRRGEPDYSYGGKPGGGGGPHRRY